MSPKPADEESSTEGNAETSLEKASVFLSHGAARPAAAEDAAEGLSRNCSSVHSLSEDTFLNGTQSKTLASDIGGLAFVRSNSHAAHAAEAERRRQLVSRATAGATVRPPFLSKQFDSKLALNFV